MSRSALGRRFDVGLLLRIAVLVGCGAALAWAVTRPGLYATTLLAGLATAAALAELLLFVRRTNITVARFVEALGHGDFTQQFATGADGSGFADLRDSLNAATARLRAERAETQTEVRFLSALVDDVPSPLLGIDAAGQATLLNKAARRLLANAGPGLSAHGERFAADVARVRPGERLATQLMVGGAPVAAIVSAAEVLQPGRGPNTGSVRIVAVQPIQQELDRAELAAQTDLVRVLTHEIMNSMTPVTSLSATAASLIAAADTGDDPAIADARAAIETVARRAEGVMHFVRTYRQLTRPPELRRRQVGVAQLFAELQRLVVSDWPPERLALTVTTDPATLAIHADPDLLAQLLINLLKNAAEAATGHAAAPAVRLTAQVLKGGGTAIDVSDNGAGIPEADRQDIFLPFFSTKAEGTGVGLSLARQIALAHGGSLTCQPANGGGTRFRLIL